MLDRDKREKERLAHSRPHHMNKTHKQ